MNKDVKSLRQLALPLLIFALCVAVQRSDSAVSAANTFFFSLQRKKTNKKKKPLFLPPPHPS